MRVLLMAPALWAERAVDDVVLCGEFADRPLA